MRGSQKSLEERTNGNLGDRRLVLSPHFVFPNLSETEGRHSFKRTGVQPLKLLTHIHAGQDDFETNPSCFAASGSSSMLLDCKAEATVPS